MLEQIKEKISDLPTLKKYKSLKEEWAKQNELIDNQTAMLNARDRKIVNQTGEINRLMEKNLSDRQKYDRGFTKKNNKIKSLKEELEEKNHQLLELELLRKKTAGKVGGLKAYNNRLEQEKVEMAEIIENLSKQNNLLKSKVPKATLKDYVDYQYNLRKVKKNLKKESEKNADNINNISSDIDSISTN